MSIEVGFLGRNLSFAGYCLRTTALFLNRVAVGEVCDHADLDDPAGADRHGGPLGLAVVAVVDLVILDGVEVDRVGLDVGALALAAEGGPGARDVGGWPV